MRTYGRVWLFTQLLGLLLIASISAFADNSKTLKVFDSASIQGTQIPAGEYKVTWESHSPEATVKFFKGKNTVATVVGKWVDRDIQYDRNMVVSEKKSDGSVVIIEIRFAGMNKALVFGETS